MDALVAALTSSSNAGVISGIDRLIIDANDAFLDMVGLDRSELDGGFDWRRLRPDDDIAADDLHVDDITGNRCDVRITQVRHRDGTSIPVLIVGFGISHGRLTWISIVIDITSDERLVELANLVDPDRTAPHLEPETPRTVLDSVMMTAPVGIAVVDQRGRVIRTNQEFDALAESLPALAGHAPDGDNIDESTVLARTFDKVRESGQPVTETVVNSAETPADDAQIVAHAYPVTVDGDEAGDSIVDTIRHTNTVMCGVDHATACLAILDTETGELEYAIAGHPPPLIRRWDGGVEVLDAPRGLLLGVVPDIDVRVGHAVLAPTESLVVYTDGLIERRTEVIDTGIERLCMAVRGAGQQQPPFGDRLLEVVSDGISHDDDVCLLVATRVDGRSEPALR
jgi:PAS domain S-box-containing protein